jgi:hypothetical protein
VGVGDVAITALRFRSCREHGGPGLRVSRAEDVSDGANSRQARHPAGPVWAEVATRGRPNQDLGG